jgi:hypothetical protein
MTDDIDLEPKNETASELGVSGEASRWPGDLGSDPSFLDLFGQVPGYILGGSTGPSYFESKAKDLRGWLDRNPDVTISPGYSVTLKSKDYEVFVLRQHDYSSAGIGDSVTVGFGKPWYGYYFTYGNLHDHWNFAVGVYTFGYIMTSIDISKTFETQGLFVDVGLIAPSWGKSIGTIDTKIEMSPVMEISEEIDMGKLFHKALEETNLSFLLISYEGLIL